MNHIIAATMLATAILGLGCNTAPDRPAARAEPVQEAECEPRFGRTPEDFKDSSLKGDYHDTILAEHGNWKALRTSSEDEYKVMAAGGPDGCHVIEIGCAEGSEAMPAHNVPANDPRWWGDVTINFPDELPTFTGRTFRSGHRALKVRVSVDSKALGSFDGVGWPGQAHPVYPHNTTIKGDDDGTPEAVYRRLILPLARSQEATFVFDTMSGSLSLGFDLAGARDAIRDIAERCGLR